jgi:hypothetical protein
MKGSGKPPPQPVTIYAIGPDGWVIVERRVDFATRIVVEDAVDAVRAAVRAETGWDPRVEVRNDRGRDMSRRFGIPPW